MDIKKEEQTSSNVQPQTTEQTNAAETTSVKEASTDKKEESTEKTEDSKGKSKLALKRLDESFVYDVMQVPTATHHEYRMVMFIIIWAKRNNINYEMDDYGNLYLTKGVLDEGESYPCVTSHLDTVQDNQIIYAKAGANLEVKTSIEDGKHKIYVDDFGIGGDDKAGILLSLSMFKFFDKLKACFFLEEEIGNVGSSHLNKDWFNNVGYVIGYDSPDLNRAAYKCAGVKLMNKAFFTENGLDEICKKHGLDDFRAEPYTDVVQIRKQTNVMCMNFGTGYYRCHMPNEYCIIEDMDAALDMGVEIIEKLGRVRYTLPSDTKENYVKDADSMYFEGLKPRPTYSYTSPYYNNNYNQSYSGSSSYNTTKPTVVKNEVNSEMVKYVVDVYDQRISDIEDDVKAKCEELGINFNETFATIFSTQISF